MIETNQIFQQKEGVNQIELRKKKRPNWIINLKNGGHHRGTSLPCPSMDVLTAPYHIAQKMLGKPSHLWQYNDVFG